MTVQTTTPGEPTGGEVRGDGRVALVTGAGRGIGRAVAIALAARGFSVAIAARSHEQLAQVAQAAGSAATVAPLAVDLREVEGAETLIERVVERFGRLDVLVNNAGIGHFGPLEGTSAAAWDELMAVNVRAPFLLCRAGLPHLRRARPGFVINIASIVGLRGYADQVAYTASKHALVGLSRALAQELHEHGDDVRVHVLCPGGTATDLLRAARPDIAEHDAMQPSEIAELVAFLVTRSGNAVLGEITLRRASARP